MLSRKVITRRGRRFRGYFPSRKLGRMVAWESFREWAVILLLEFSWGVVSYREQPILIQYRDGVETRDYYPDFEVVLADGTLLHLEVKPASELAKPEIEAKFRAIAAHYARHQMNFRIVTEQEFWREPLLSNVRILAYLLGKSEETLPSPHALLQLIGSNPLRFQDAEEKFGREMVLRLIAAGTFACDLTQPLGGVTPLTVVTGGRHATYLL